LRHDTYGFVEYPGAGAMQIFGSGDAASPPIYQDRRASRDAATAPFAARSGTARSPAHARAAAPGRKGWTHAILQFFVGGPRRAALAMRQAEKRLDLSMKDFVVMWSGRRIDEISARDGAKLLKIVCTDALRLAGRASHTAGANDAIDAADARDAAGPDQGDYAAGAADTARPRSDTGESLAGSAIFPVKPALRAILRNCVGAMPDQAGLSLLYDDLATPPRAARDLPDRLARELRPIAAAVLDLLEQAVARELALRIGKPVLLRLLDAATRSPPAPAAVRDALEQLHGIGLWLSSPERGSARVLDSALDTLTDEQLGRLAAQAWPELSALDERYGEDPAAMAAAIAFVNACDADALAIWREALGMQLRRRKRVVAARVADSVVRANGLERMADAVRATYALLDDTARTLTGHLPNVSVLRARIRDEALALALQRLPAPLRRASLRALPAHDLSSLRSSLHASADMAEVRTTVGVTVETVQADMLAADRRAVEEALAALHAALDREDRAAAVAQLGTLGRAAEELKSTQAAFGIATPAPLLHSLAHAVACMRALLLCDAPGGDAGAVRRLADIELGQLRAAIRPLAPFGALIDKNALNLEVRIRSAMPFSARERMDRLLDVAVDKDATVLDIFAALRDLADVLVRHTRRRAELGEEISADANEALAHDLVETALNGRAGDDGEQLARIRRALARHQGIAVDTLYDPLYALAVFSASRPAEEAAGLNRLMTVLTLAGHVQRHLFLSHGGAGPMRADTSAEPPAASADAGTRGGGDDTPGNGDRDSNGRGIGIGSGSDVDSVRVAMAGQFGVEWQAHTQTARPIVTSRHHALFRQRLTAPAAAQATRSRAIRLPVADGEASWFSLDDAFVRDMLSQPGMSLAVEGINARGHPVRHTGFDPALDKDERAAAAGAAMQALRALAGDAAHGLTRILHRGLPAAFAAALGALPDESPLRLPDGTRVLLPASARDVTHFHVRRRADGHYLIETVISWRAIDSAVRAQPRSGDSCVIALDASRSRVRATFVLATDAQGAVTGLWEDVDIRYALCARQDPPGG
jgi:hypothetical protein